MNLLVLPMSYRPAIERVPLLKTSRPLPTLPRLQIRALDNGCKLIVIPGRKLAQLPPAFTRQEIVAGSRTHGSQGGSILADCLRKHGSWLIFPIGSTVNTSWNKLLCATVFVYKLWTARRPVKMT
ncbi:hypothetical protein R1flu_023854 [Riccia fluitans]|uniref:Uncharacterized protein n=1 Tax=Riccia fluitans TaxID=41844 RepID=A0ABD1XTD5_9MARC